MQFVDPSPSPSQQVVKGPLGCKLPVAGLGQSARVRVVDYQQVKSPGRINPWTSQRPRATVSEQQPLSGSIETSLGALGYLGKLLRTELYARG